MCEVVCEVAGEFAAVKLRPPGVVAPPRRHGVPRAVRSACMLPATSPSTVPCHRLIAISCHFMYLMGCLAPTRAVANGAAEPLPSRPPPVLCVHHRDPALSEHVAIVCSCPRACCMCGKHPMRAGGLQQWSMVNPGAPLGSRACVCAVWLRGFLFHGSGSARAAC
mgnify:CR=1 FL=1